MSAGPFVARGIAHTSPGALNEFQIHAIPIVSLRILAAMRSTISEELRERQIREGLRLTPAERIQIALDMGEADLLLFMKANQLPRAEAIRRLRAGKHAGRRPSCASPEER